ncbi:MAG TPA: DUF4234 domain-containing protein [Marinagarivorans sp.]
MEEKVDNPYKAPEAQVEAPATGELNQVFDRFTAWGVFGLSIITLGIYSVYWLYKRTQRVNDRTNSNISSAFVNATLVVYTISLLSNLGELVAPELAAVLGLAALAAWVMMIVWAFKIRAAIHEYVNASKGNYDWANAFLTFFFGALYLQYKINKIIDNQ